MNLYGIKLFVIGTFILFPETELYDCRTFWLSCFFIKDVDNATDTVGIAFQRGKRPVLLRQSRLKKMSSASGNERNGVQYDFIHSVHTQQSIYIVCRVRCGFREVTDVCAVFSPFVQHWNGIVRCHTVKGFLPDFIKTATVKAQILIDRKSTRLNSSHTWI